MPLKHYLIIESNRDVICTIESVMQKMEMFGSLGHTACHQTAIELIITTRPDLVFINIDGAIGQAFGFTLELLLYHNTVPDFIALSANKKQAYQAIKHGFYDYLLKPVSPTEIHKSMARHQKKFGKGHELVCLKSYKDFQFLNTWDILFLQADNNTTDFHMTNGDVITAFKTLKTYEDKLPDHFKRIHKSYIINILKVSRIDFGKASCKLRGLERHIPFSKKFLGNMDSIHRSLCNASY